MDECPDSQPLRPYRSRSASMKTQVGINAVAGRMGQRLIHLLKEDSALALVAALESPSSPYLGRDAGEVCGLGNLDVPISSTLPLDHRLDVLMDFSVPEGTLAILPVCVERRIP